MSSQQADEMKQSWVRGMLDSKVRNGYVRFIVDGRHTSEVT